MENYNFWADFFDTYQSLSDGVKILWLVVPPAFVLGLVALGLRYRLALKTRHDVIEGELIYSVHRDEYDQLRVYRRNSEVESEPARPLFGKEETQNMEIVRD